jgi:hypothetical protein
VRKKEAFDGAVKDDYFEALVGFDRCDDLI